MQQGYTEHTAGKRFQVYGFGDGEYTVVDTATGRGVGVGTHAPLQDAADYAAWRNKIVGQA